MTDILFKTDNYIFSYRVAGICINDGKVLLHKPTNDTGYAFPGGHVSFGETNEETLIREFKEEIDADISVGDLKWVGEVFFPWENKQCHQICLFYDVTINNINELPDGDVFLGNEHFDNRDFKIEFHRISLDSVYQLEIYPTNAKELMSKLDSGVQHFIYREE